MVGTATAGTFASRTLTSAWIETNYYDLPEKRLAVALSRVRGLKQTFADGLDSFQKSHSHECVD